MIKTWLNSALWHKRGQYVVVADQAGIIVISPYYKRLEVQPGRNLETIPVNFISLSEYLLAAHCAANMGNLLLVLFFPDFTLQALQARALCFALINAHCYMRKRKLPHDMGSGCIPVDGSGLLLKDGVKSCTGGVFRPIKAMFSG
jgi:hypothetical protein